MLELCAKNCTACVLAQSYHATLPKQFLHNQLEASAISLFGEQGIMDKDIGGVVEALPA